MKLSNADVVMLIGRLLTSCPLDVHNFFLNGILLYKNDTFSFCTSLNIRLWVRKAALLDWNVMFWNEFVDVDNCTLWVWICNWRADLVWSLFFVVGIILFFFLCQNSNSVSGIPGQLEDPAQSSPQENIFAPLVLMVRISRNRSSPVPSVWFFFFFKFLFSDFVVLQVRGFLCLLRFCSEQFGAAGEKLIMCDRPGRGTLSEAPPWGLTVLLHPICTKWLPDSDDQLPGRVWM